MGKMKELCMDLAVEYHNPLKVDLIARLQGATPRDQAWHLSQLGYIRNYWDKDGFSLLEPRSPLVMSDKVFIGGEGIPKNVYKICRQCLWEFNSVLHLSFAKVGDDYRLRSETLPELEFTIQDNSESCPTDEPQSCACDNWMWDRVGHDVLMKYVAKGDISPEIATSWINRNLSYNLDTRAYNEDFIDSAIIEWETRWRA